MFIVYSSTQAAPYFGETDYIYQVVSVKMQHFIFLLILCLALFQI